MATLAVKRGMQALGATLLVLTAWEALVLLAELPRGFGALSFWLFLGVNLPVWLPCWMGGIALLRGRTSGFIPLYLAIALLVAREVAFFIRLLGWLLEPPCYGGVGRSWPVVLALLLLPPLAHGLCVRHLPAESARHGRRWYWWLCLALLLGTLYVGCSFARRRIDWEAGEVAQQGVAAHEEGRHEEALEKWGQVIDRYPYTPAWGVAVFNTGCVLRDRHLYGQAIARFESLLGAGLNDRDPSSNILAPYQNYRHRACLEISYCYEALGDYPTALRFAVLARDKYPYQNFTGTDLEAESRFLEDRIEYLEGQGREDK